MKIPALIKMITLCFLTLFLSNSVVVAADKGVVIKIATLAPEGSTWMRIFNELNDEVKAKTGKKVRFRIYPGGVLGDEDDILRKMHIGQIHGAVLTSSGLAALFSEINVFQIPFLLQSYDEADYLLMKMDAFFRKGFRDNRHVLLGWTEMGFVSLMSTVPIAVLNDLKKAKVWVWENSPMAQIIFDEAGVIPIPLTMPDVLVGLQTGLVDVVYAPPAGAISLQWFTKIKYMTDIPLIYLIGGIVIKQGVFNKIPKVSQDVLMECLQKYMEKLKSLVRNENQEAVRVMKKHGIKIIKPPKEEIDQFRKLSDRALARLAGSRGKVFSEGIRNEVEVYLDNYRSRKK